MKIKVSVTVDLSPEQVKTLVTLAETTGHTHDGVKAPGKIIRRYLTSRVEEAVAYCHEHLNKD
jgi:hypothetical protein